MVYLMGFVTPVPTASKEAYMKHAAASVETFKSYGATRLVEAWGDEVPKGQMTDFYRAVDARPDETVVFSWMEFPDKAASDAADAKMNADPAMAGMMESMPFDASRMIFAGFEVIHQTGTQSAECYIDGALVPIRTARKADYLALAKTQFDAINAQGALRIVEGWGDFVPKGKKTDFIRAVAAKDDETVGFSMIVWPSKQARDEGWAKIMEDPSMAPTADSPHDEERRVFGGFVPLLVA